MRQLRSFNSFRQAFRYQLLWPPPLFHIVEFIAYLSCNGYTYSTARAYIASISFHSKIQNCPDVTKTFLVGKLLEGMRRIKNCRDTRLPITLPLLTRIVQVLPVICFDTYEFKLFRAAYVLAFFGFLRVGEFSLSVGNDIQYILQVSDVKFAPDMSRIYVKINSSKSDQHRRGVTLTIDRVESILCPVRCLHDYLIVRCKTGGPLFVHAGGKALTRYQFSSVLEKSLNALGVHGRFKAHSFRIGAATAAFEAGCSPDAIMQAGRWKSKVYKAYIRCPPLGKY